jgi:protein disulfide isomerase family A protein 3
VASDYQGPREADGIIKYMRTKAGPAAKDLTDLATADKFLSHYEHSIVCFVTMANSKLLVEFKKLADSLAESYRFGYSSNPEVLAKYGHTDKIVIYQPQRLQVRDT